MITVNTHEAKTRFSALLQKVEKERETVLVCRNGHPVAEIHAVTGSRDGILPEPSAKLAVRMKYNPTEPVAADEWPEESR